LMQPLMLPPGEGMAARATPTPATAAAARPTATRCQAVNVRMVTPG
jgi:hypothetical protein